MRDRSLGLALIGALLAGGTTAVIAQPATPSIRVAFVRQWVVNQHRVPVFGFPRSLSPELGAALERGVVDRTVFAWQRGRIQRWWMLSKPIRVLPAPEAAPLGGRGPFDLVAVRPPRGTAAWTEVEVGVAAAQPDDVLILEVGGEVSTMTQLLETLAVMPAGGGPLREVRLRPQVGRGPADPGDTVPVVTAPVFGHPLEAARSARFGRIAGIDILVVRNPIGVIADGEFTSNGVADIATETAGEWREGDRVLLRVPVATLRGGPPSLLLGWKDRVTKPESEGGGRSLRPESLLRPRRPAGSSG